MGGTSTGESAHPASEAPARGAAGSAAPASEAPASLEELANHLYAEANTVNREIEEIDLLVSQAKIEAGRHESRRAAAADKLAQAAERLAAGGGGSPKELAELATQLVGIARRAALMEAQIDLLEGKRKAAVRLHESTVAHAEQVRGLGGSRGGAGDVANLAGVAGADAGPGDAAGEPHDGGGGSGAQLVLSAQEDLRREIARQMHDGPAQSLTNIVLQAQIVERLVADDPARAAQEVGALVAMVQRTLDATKTFIFDVRPMVLDDLGLMATLRRATRDRGGRVGVKVEFESIGVDRRLPVELESGLFRLLDDALVAHLAGKPDRLSLKLDWGEALQIELTAGRNPITVEAPELPPEGADLPPALAAMVEERRIAHRDAVEAARIASLARLPERLWREVSGRARTLGVTAELLDEGARLRLVVPLPEPAEAAAAPA
ncbi:MAG: hypothetical protein FIA92_16240 [Chloroflexi bacterium]|nr:hypothetical protein [Chloroflexota bacterium]